jgi:hypothetical protein
VAAAIARPGHGTTLTSRRLLRGVNAGRILTQAIELADRLRHL